MPIQIRRRTAIRAVSYLIAAFAVMGGFVYCSHQDAARARQSMALSGQHAFAELSTAVTELNTALQKSVYVTSPSVLGSVCGEIYAKAQVAQMAMGELPYANVELEQTAEFLAKVGDYANALSRSAAREGTLSQDTRSGLQGLAAASDSLARSVQQLETELNDRALTLESLEQATRRLSAAAKDGAASPADTVFQAVEEEFPEVPTLIYDGPFSQHLSQRTPLGLKDTVPVTPEQARQIAADFLSLSPDLLTPVSVNEGELPSYSFTVNRDGAELYLEVTRQGGQVVEYFSSRAVGEESFTYSQAVEIADKFLSDHGFDGMRENYFIDQGGLLTIHYTFFQDDTCCYPDLVKVTVALDTGTVEGFEAAGYYWNHTRRTLAAPSISEAQARSRVSPLLEILSSQLAVIPTPGENEVFCYEFKCQNQDGRHFLVYLNADTGAEEKILILLEDESGTLVL